MSKCTPGPWDYESFALREEIKSETNQLIAFVCSVHCESPEQMRANARLIAAAPELVAALERLSDEYENQQGQFGSDYIWKKYEDAGAIEEARRLLDELKGD